MRCTRYYISEELSMDKFYIRSFNVGFAEVIMRIMLLSEDEGNYFLKGYRAGTLISYATLYIPTYYGSLFHRER